MSNKKINYDFNLINKAFNIASEKHQNQTRKGSDIPYLIHLMDVASILFQFKASTDQVCAGFLHDTIEDTPYTLEELKEDFNQQVHDFVKFSTENMEEKGPDHSNESWEKRKIEVIEKSKLASNDELLVMFADKLANIRSFVQDYKELGEKLWEKFNGNKEKQKWFYSSLYQIFKDKFGQNQEVKLFLVEFDEHVASLWPKS
ncbi:bifunctional (p)ppGpp synthetase/guanosine-3',5'-bis(diphosphate) 3'-pyrophosphohydrolase [archaeon]|jgi:(p)ppGpp synthase/HD superfamily hydrolase|nr:bifunctional (p)ppGpp synthetase/guanosine-3',5'-bis(diphosphate) 3'-pyrophosphohydrolase [archaeon]MBT6762827.1 bifunctional (p)ppGpp synthetase/guanosine-3',5'-bis(diphosphate) 3'-pyrophosphohydrolase [archaeon]